MPSSSHSFIYHCSLPAHPLFFIFISMLLVFLHFLLLTVETYFHKEFFLVLVLTRTNSNQITAGHNEFLLFGPYSVPFLPCFSGLHRSSIEKNIMSCVPPVLFHKLAQFTRPIHFLVNLLIYCQSSIHLTLSIYRFLLTTISCLQHI